VASDISFNVKAKAEFADDFRRAFEAMKASVSERFLDEGRTVVRFEVRCQPDQVAILEQQVPIHAYAGVAYTGRPPL